MDTPDFFHSHVISLFFLATVLGMIFYHLVRFIFVKKTSHEESGFLGTMSQNISVLYGILLAFIVVISWQNYSFLQSTVLNEATQVGALWRDTLAFDKETKGQLATNIVNYLDSVRKYEWPQMEMGDETIDNPAYNALWNGFLTITPQTEAQKIFLQSAAQHLDNISELRRTRIGSSSASLPGEIWALLFFGAICSLFIVMIFESVSLWLRYVVASLEFILILMTFLIINAFDNPYSSFLAINSEPYQETLDIITHSSQYVAPVNSNNNHADTSMH